MSAKDRRPNLWSELSRLLLASLQLARLNLDALGTRSQTVADSLQIILVQY